MAGWMLVLYPSGGVFDIWANNLVFIYFYIITALCVCGVVLETRLGDYFTYFYFRLNRVRCNTLKFQNTIHFCVVVVHMAFLFCYAWSGRKIYMYINQLCMMLVWLVVARSICVDHKRTARENIWAKARRYEVSSKFLPLALVNQPRRHR